MKMFFAASMFAAGGAVTTIEDIKIALMAAAVLLIPSGALLIKAAIDAQTESLLRARRSHRRDDPVTEDNAQ
jgi:hypothetical protein